MNAEEFNKRMMPLRAVLVERAMALATDHDAAEDLVQETLMRLWQLGDKLAQHPNVEALALTILRNMHTDYWRRQQRFASDEELLKRWAVTESPDDLELIELIVKSLPPLQQQIFRMKEVEGYEKEEIMLVTGCTDESLRQNLSRARRRIRELYMKMNRL